MAPEGNNRGLGAEELRSMYERVIKLAAENKINKNNAWDVDIIYHMPSIIKCVTAQNASMDAKFAPSHVFASFIVAFTHALAGQS